MKYFTPDIWAGWQGNEAVFDRARRKWNRNFSRYKRSLPGLARRLGQRHGRFFTKHSLHDGRILLFAASDWPGIFVGRKWPMPQTRLEMAVLAGGRDALIYRLLYTGVTEILVQTKNDLFSLTDSRFGDWGYDELLPERNGSFRHNILFQTGTEISIAFRAFRFDTKKATPGKLRRYAACGS
ncbi:MAG: hypothetical protein C5B50_26480 [Verrucomicrobia bacterium]|nr:MAG: hypothetical protein C5B50_26480 [Verrucomicrobiota bacterium]